MTPLAHHAGEQALVSFVLLLAGGGLSVAVAIGRARLADARSRLSRRLWPGTATRTRTGR